ncbi:MAG: LamG domain-containing protein, partial [Planctomycetes bacterium]|nr:LamG domain-containing protein [Planctomycetota bacterium]
MCRKRIDFVSLVLVLITVGSASADLVAHWEFNEGSGSVAHDTSGNGHDGTINGTPQWVPGKIRGALEFDGSNYVDIASGVTSLSDSFTITAWIKTSRIGMCIVSKSDSNTSWASQEKQFYVADPALEGQSNGGAELVGWGCDWVRNDDTVPVSDGTWHHVCVTWDAASGEGLIYVDGENHTGNETYSGCPDNPNDTIRIGFSPGEHSANFVGLIDDVRIYNHALTQEEIAQAMEGSPGSASNPAPENEDTDVALDRALSWIPGEFANTHDVYLGTSFDDVNDASTDNPLGVLVSQGQSESAFDPGRLPFSETYYWRVDEVNGAPDFTVYKGDVWSFTIEPIAYPLSSVTATASSSFGASGPENTINGSGLVDDLHGVSAADMWISGGIPATLEYAFDRAYKLHELWIWNSNQLIEAFVGFGAKDVVIEHSLDGENWTVLDGVGPLAQATGTEGYAHNNTIDFGGATAQQVRLTINSVQGIAPQASLSEVRFLFIPTFATRPNPAAGATDVAPDTTLSWGRNGREADR